MLEVQFFTAKQKRAINEGEVAKAITAAMKADRTLKPIDKHQFRSDYWNGKIVLGYRTPNTDAETIVFFGYLTSDEGRSTLGTAWIHPELRGQAPLQLAQNWLRTHTT